VADEDAWFRSSTVEQAPYVEWLDEDELVVRVGYVMVFVDEARARELLKGLEEALAD
jgi:hydrogenase maturation factor